MKHCPNSLCAGLARTGLESEFSDVAVACSDCGAELEPGAALGHEGRPAREPMRFSIAAKYTYAHEAQLAASLLRAHDFEVRLGNENVIGVHSLLSFAVGGVELLVPAEELKRARAILRRARALPATRAAQRRSCVRCGSEKLAPRPVSVASALFSTLLLGVPLVLGRPRARCASCGGEVTSSRSTRPAAEDAPLLSLVGPTPRPEPR